MEEQGRAEFDHGLAAQARRGLRNMFSIQGRNDRFQFLRGLCSALFWLFVFALPAMIAETTWATEIHNDTASETQIAIIGTCRLLLYLGFPVAYLVLSLAVVRRLHDLGLRSAFGFLMLIPGVAQALVVIGLFWPGQKAPNAFGAPPRSFIPIWSDEEPAG